MKRIFALLVLLAAASLSSGCRSGGHHGHDHGDHAGPVIMDGGHGHSH